METQQKFEIQIEEVKRVEEGKQIGKIVQIDYREKPYRYTDIVIELANGIRLKTGFPTSITQESKLGKLLIKFGIELKVGTKICLEDVLIGKAITFLTVNNETERGTFARVIQESIKQVV